MNSLATHFLAFLAGVAATLGLIAAGVWLLSAIMKADAKYREDGTPDE